MQKVYISRNYIILGGFVKSYKILLMMFLVFGLLGNIRGIDPIAAGDLYFMHVNTANYGDEDIDELKVRVFIYDLGIMLRTSYFDLDNDDKSSKYIFWEVPYDIEPGNYWARITISNDDIREVKHRLITIT